MVVELKWIPVEEALPEEYEQVMVTLKDRSRNDAWVDFGCMFYNDIDPETGEIVDLYPSWDIFNEYYSGSANKSTDNIIIIAWSPMPKPFGWKKEERSE